MPGAPFDDLARAYLGELFGQHQDPGGGFPETFPGTAPGCWTSAEIYAAACVFRLDEFLPPGGLDRLEAWLLDACARSGGRGLSHYPVDERGTLVTEASAALAIGLRARHGAHPVADQVEAWIASTQHASGGWGIAAGEDPRTYSTAYAVDALGGSPHADALVRGQAWLAATRRPDGTWPFRPGVSAPAWLPTRLAAYVLAIPAGSQGAERLVDHLLRVGESAAAVEEDEFPTRSGLKMSLAYADRLVCIAGALDLVGPRDASRRHRCLAALARYENDRRGDTTGTTWIGGQRLWHALDFAWGYGAIRRHFGRQPALVPLYEELREADRRARAVQTLTRTLPSPLASVARRALETSESPSEGIEAHVALCEATGRYVRAVQWAKWPAENLGVILREAVARGPAGAGRNLGTRPPAHLRRSDPLALALAASGSAARRWTELRNNVAHRPAGTPAGRARSLLALETAALGVMEHLAPALAGAPLCTVQEVSHPLGSRLFRYRVRRWRGLDARADDELVETTTRLADHVRLEHPAGTEGRTAWIDTGGGVQGLRLLSPLVVRASCPACAVPHFFVADHLQPGTIDGAPLLLHLTAVECGGQVVSTFPY